MSRGFTLLEVLVALTILGLAIVTLVQLSSQGLRLLSLSDDYQQAVLVADRVARSTDTLREGVASGQEGPFLWERRVALVPVAEELTPDAGPQPASTRSRWRCEGSNRALELASLRAVAGRRSHDGPSLSAPHPLAPPLWPLTLWPLTSGPSPALSQRGEGFCVGGSR